MDENAQKELLKFFIKAFETVVTPRIERLEKKVDEYRDELIGFKDDFAGKWKTLDEEQTIMSQRLDDIEATPTVAHELKKK